MKRTSFNDVNKVILNGKRSVFVRSWDSDAVEIRYPENRECDIEFNDGRLEIDSKSYYIISMPEKTDLLIERIYGNFETAGNINSMVVENINGNCSIQSANVLTIENVSGNCKLGMIGSQTSIRNIGGNLSFIAENGIMDIHAVGGNLSGIVQGLTFSTTVGGNLKLKIDHFVGEENRLRAGGSIKLMISDLDNTELDARAGGIVSFNYNDKSEKSHNGKLNTKYGEAENKIQLRAGGNIKVSDQTNDFEIVHNFGTNDDDYVDEIEKKFESRTTQSSGFDFSDLLEFDGEIGDRIREKTQMAEEKIQKAMEKMERKFSFREEFGNPPRPPRPTRPSRPVSEPVIPRPTVSAEEKMMILTMLQENKINAEEAERLLRALEQS